MRVVPPLHRGSFGRVPGRLDARRPEKRILEDRALVALHELAASLGLDVAAIRLPGSRKIGVGWGRLSKATSCFIEIVEELLSGGGAEEKKRVTSTK